MITVEAYLMGRTTVEALDPVLRQHMGILLHRVNKIVPLYESQTGKIAKVNDGYRRLQDQPKHGARTSKHLTCQAIDLDDDDQATLWRWCLINLRLIADSGLYMEDPRWTHGLQPNKQVWSWCHFQSVPPGSGRRIFRPSMLEATAPDLWDGDYPPEYNLKPDPQTLAEIG